MFAVLYAAMPTDFFVNQAEYSLRYQEQAEIREEFNALDLTVFSSFGNDTMALGYTSYEDGPSPPNWDSGITDRYLEVWYAEESIPEVGGNFNAFEIRDTEKRNFLGIEYPYMLERCGLTVEGEYIGIYLTENFVEIYGIGENMTLTASGTYLRASIILKANGTYTSVYESWQNNVLDYSISWEIDFEAMKPSVWLLLGQLLTFQNPDFGIPGLFGEIISYILALGIWAAIILITYTIVTKLIPTIQGGVEN